METKMVSIRMPFDLYQWLEDQAKNQHRSMTGQIVSILEAARKNNNGGEGVTAAP